MNDSATWAQKGGSSDTRSGFTPYSKYRGAEVPWSEKLPEHWDLCRAKFLFQEMDRPVRESDEVITVFRDGTVTLRKNRRTEGYTFSKEEAGYQGIREGDLVIHSMDIFAGAVGISDADGKGSPVYVVCQPKRSDIDLRYYSYLLRSLANNDYIGALGQGIRQRSVDFRMSTFGEMRVPVLPPQEQKAISEFLDDKTAIIDDLIDKKEHLVELLEEKRTAQITRFVTEGLNREHPMKHSGMGSVGNIPDHWSVAQLRYLTERIGSGETPTGGAENYVSDGIPLIRSQNVHNNALQLDDIAYIDEDTANAMTSPVVSENDVLLNITGASLGRCCTASEEVEGARVSQHVCVLRPSSKLDCDFLAQVITSAVGQRQIFKKERGSSRQAINFQQIGEIEVPLPPLHEQKELEEKMSKHVSRLDKVYREVQAAIRLLKEYRSVLITSAVIGQIDVRDCAV